MRSAPSTVAFFLLWSITWFGQPTRLEARTWTDDTGKFRIEADFVGVRGGKVLLKKQNGITIGVPINRLSVADRRFLQALNTPAPAATAGVGAGASADQAVRQLMADLEAGKLDAAWNYLPPSYQKDVTGVVQSFASAMDAEIWDGGFRVVGKVVRVLDEKRQFIQGMGMLQEQLQDAPVDQATIDAGWSALVGVLKTIVTSDISSLDKMKTMDVGSFLKTTGAKLTTQVAALSKLAGENAELSPVPIAGAKDVEITVVSANAQTTVLSMKAGEEVKEQVFVSVEGRWIPQEMAAEWKAGVAQARAGIDQLQRLDEMKQVILPQIQQIEAVADGLLAAGTQAEFDQAVGGVMLMLAPLMAGGGGGGFPGGGGLRDFGN